jgi:predicted nucleotidyltransferase
MKPAMVDCNIVVLLERIVPALAPEAVYLFGSRARGEETADSDYDLLVVVPDDTPAENIRLTRTCALSRGTGIPADVIACRRSWFEQGRDRVGTLSYKAVREGVLVHGA